MIAYSMKHSTFGIPEGFELWVIPLTRFADAAIENWTDLDAFNVSKCFSIVEN